MFEKLKAKAKEQIILDIATGEVTDEFVHIVIDGCSYMRRHDANEKLIEELIEILDKNLEEKISTDNRKAEATVTLEFIVTDEVDELIKNRSNGTYSDISDTASAIVEALGTDSKYTYFFSQIANKLARVKNGYSVEDSLLDIAGYAKLELERLRNEDV